MNRGAGWVTCAALLLVGLAVASPVYWKRHTASAQPTFSVLAADFQTPRTILVRFGKGVPTDISSNVITQENLSPGSCFSEINTCSYQISANDSAQEVVQRLRYAYAASGVIETAEVDALFPQADTQTDNDPLYAGQWHLFKINAPQAWTVTEGAGVTIGIADSSSSFAGLPDLSQNSAGKSFLTQAQVVQSEHTKQIASLIAGIPNNSTQGAGVASSVQLIPLQVGSGTTASADAIIQAILYATSQHIQIVNVSYGATDLSPSIVAATEYAKALGTLVIFAEGNTGASSGIGNQPGSIHVGASDLTDSTTGFSGFGDDLDVVAPGASLLNASATPSSGTSLAAAITSGVAALTWSANPHLSAAQIQAILYSTATASNWNAARGWGRIDAFKAVTLAKMPATPAIPLAPTSLGATATYDANSEPTATLTWSPVSATQPILGYQIYRNGAVIGTSTSTSYIDTSGAAGTFAYSVAAIGFDGTLSATASVTLSIPERQRVVRFQAVKNSPTSVEISWSTIVPTSGSVTLSGTTQTDTQSGANHTLTFSGLTPGKTYTYQIEALGDTPVTTPVSSVLTAAK